MNWRKMRDPRYEYGRSGFATRDEADKALHLFKVFISIDPEKPKWRFKPRVVKNPIDESWGWYAATDSQFTCPGCGPDPIRGIREFELKP